MSSEYFLTCARLNFLGKDPSANDKDVSLEIIGAKVFTHFFKSDVHRDNVQRRQFRPTWHGTNDICHFVIGCGIGDVEFCASLPHVGHQVGRYCSSESRGNIGSQIANLFHD